MSLTLSSKRENSSELVMEAEFGADGVQAIIGAGGFGEAAVGDVLVEDAGGELPVGINEVTDPGADHEGQTEILALGVGNVGAVGETETNAGLDVRNPARPLLDKVVAGAEGGADKTVFRSVNNLMIKS